MIGGRRVKKESIVAEARKVLTEDDYAISATSLMLRDYLKALQLINKCEVDRILDIGCGLGGISRLVADLLSASEVYGVDMDSERLKVAESRGVKTIKADLNTDKLPFSSDYFDLVISNGVIEHLCFYDNHITESYRVLKKGGHLVITWPNLANYIQRISLLLGYQPSDVEISKEIYVGTIFLSGRPSEGHVHSCTINAMRQLLEYYGFTVVGVRKGNPRMVGLYSKWNFLFKIVGYLCPTSLARRIIIIARK